MPLMKDEGRRKGIAVIISKRLGGESEEQKPMNEMGDEMDSDMGMKAAMEEFKGAMEAGSTRGMMEAMKSFMEMVTEEAKMKEESEEQGA